mgnify:FL=1
MSMLKQGTTFALAVDFSGVDLDKAERIEFIFRRGPTNASPLIKRCSWPGEAQREEGGSRILVPWTEAETWLVPGDGTFYLDTRITLRGVRDQPATNLVALRMERTLFEPTEGADDP